MCYFGKYSLCKFRKFIIKHEIKYLPNNFVNIHKILTQFFQCCVYLLIIANSKRCFIIVNFVLANIISQNDLIFVVRCSKCGKVVHVAEHVLVPCVSVYEY